MIFEGYLWLSVIINGYPWYWYFFIHGFQWLSMVSVIIHGSAIVHGYQWLWLSVLSMGLCGLSMVICDLSMVINWLSMVNYPWINRK